MHTLYLTRFLALTNISIVRKEEGVGKLIRLLMHG